MTVDFATSFYFHPEGEGILFGMSDRDEPPAFTQDVDWSLLDPAIRRQSAARRAERDLTRKAAPRAGTQRGAKALTRRDAIRPH